MTEKITSLRARGGSIAARNLRRKWQDLTHSMKCNTLRLLLLLSIFFLPTLSASAETVCMITSQDQGKNDRHFLQWSDNGLAILSMSDNQPPRFFWEEQSKNPWDGLLHFMSGGLVTTGYGVNFRIYTPIDGGYRITKVIFRDTEGCGRYSNAKGLERLSIETGGYSRKFDENACDNYVGQSYRGKYKDNNNLVFENIDGNPQHDLTFKTHEDKKSDQFKCRMIMVILKKVRNYEFSTGTFNLKIGDKVNNCFTSPNEDLNKYNDFFTYAPGGVVHITKDATNGYVVTADKVGTTTVTADLPTDNDFLKYSVSATFNVSRQDLPATLSSSSPVTMNAWDQPAAPVVQGKPGDYTGTVSWTSSDETVAKVVNGKIVFGGTGYGKTATLTANLSQDDKYNAAKLSFNVTVNNEMHIANKTDWEEFCRQVMGGNGRIKATLTANITTPVTTSAGTTAASYAGTFEGNSHSIALNLKGGEYTAPFTAADGATIRNLSVTGNISATGKFAGSLVGLIQGNDVTIDHCQSSVAIASSVNGDGSHGGLVGLVNIPVKINNCIFSGSIKGASTNNCGGLVGWINTSGQNTKFSNCLITATYTVGAEGSNAVGRNAQGDVKNVYFLNNLGRAPYYGTEQVSAEQLKSGYVAYKLQNGQSTQVWGQKINTGNVGDQTPVFSTDANKRVWASTFRPSIDNSKVLAVRYCNQGQTPAQLKQEEIVAYIKANAPTHYMTYQAPRLTTQPNNDRDISVTLTDQEYLSVNDAAAWKTFCDYVDNYNNKVSAKMTNHVTLTATSPMAGTKQRYAGHFYGEGKTLTVNYTGTGQATAPFNQVEGAVIENLKTAGTIRQTATGDGYPQSHASGLVGAAYGVTINNCEVAVAISFTLTGDQDQHSGGFVGHGEGKVITMNNCKFSGSFSGPEGSRTSGIAGLVGWSAGSGSSFNNCYVAGTYKNIVDVHPLVYTSDNITVSGSNNFYCFNGIGASTWRTKGTATAVTSDEAKNGSVTYALQHGTGTKGWSQNLPGDNEPMLVFSNPKPVNKVDFAYGKAKVTRYANTGGKLLGGVPTLQDFLGKAYNDTYYYETFSFAPAFSNDSPVSADTQVAVNIKSSEFFSVSSKATWDKFCTLVSGGSRKLSAKMTADVTEAVTTMAGTSASPYQGTFDGQGHSLNVNLSGGQYVAPFSVINGATVKNLSVSGSITPSGKYAAGIASWVTGQSTITGCESKVAITSPVNGDGTHGGLVAVTTGGAGVNISNCVFSGQMNGTATNKCGGILGWPSGASTISNCLVTAAFTTSASGSATFSRNAGQATINNCYYLNAYGEKQGTPVTDAQLKNGYVASKLQEGQTQYAWAFRLGEGTMLHAFSHPDYNESEENPNYVYYDAGSWHCDHYQLSDSKSYQDSYVDFTADKITYLRSLKQGRRYTWCQPYSLTYSDDMPFRAYALSRSTGGNAVFSQVSNGSPLNALMPYLIVMKDSRDYIDYDQSATVKSYDTSLGYVERGNVKMMGTVKTITNDEASKLGAYTLQNDGSWKKVMTEDVSAYIPPFRAYLTVDGGAAGAKIGSIFSDGTTTGVENIILEDNDGTTRIYDLRGIDCGTDLDKLPAGVYIRGGKKVVKK